MKRALLLFLVAAVAVAVVAAKPGQPASRAGAVRAGGVNTAPSMRPWQYAGADTDSWWCKPDACNGVSNGTVFIDALSNVCASLDANGDCRP